MAACRRRHISVTDDELDQIPTERLNPWDRGTDESPPCYAAFWEYLTMGPQRSTAKVAVKLGKSTQIIHRWCSRHKWARRAYLWDVDQDRHRQNDHREELRKMASRHADFAKAMNGKIIRRLQEIDVKELSPRDLAMWFRILVTVERQARGAQSILRSMPWQSMPPDEEELGEKEVDMQGSIHTSIGGELGGASGDS